MLPIEDTPLNGKEVGQKGKTSGDRKRMNLVPFSNENDGIYYSSKQNGFSIKSIAEFGEVLYALFLPQLNLYFGRQSTIRRRQANEGIKFNIDLVLRSV